MTPEKSDPTGVAKAFYDWCDLTAWEVGLTRVTQRQTPRHEGTGESVQEIGPATSMLRFSLVSAFCSYAEGSF